MDGYQPYHGLGYDESMLPMSSAAGLYSGLGAARPSSYDLDHHHHLMPFSDPWYFAGDGSGPAAAPHGFAPRPLPDTYGRPGDGWQDEEEPDDEEEEAMMVEDREAEPAPEDDGAIGGSRLLSFLPPARRASILDKAGRASDVGVRAELSGMFFVAEDAILPSLSSSSAGSGRKSPPLTCYRRNLWQVSGRVTLPQQGSDLLLLDQHGRRMPILGFAVSLHATESIDGRPVQIISIPWRGEVGGSGGGAVVGDGSTGQRTPQDIALHLDHYHPDQAAAAALYGAGGKPVSFPISWNRLQFKQATANNGRRKGMQQHYFVLITLLARTAAGPRGCLWIPVVEARSGPVIVRGRSPRNFDSEREVAVTGLSDGQGGGGPAGAVERRSDMRASSSASASPKSTRVSQEGDAAAISKPERSGSAAAARLSPQPPLRHPEHSSPNSPEKGRSSSPAQRHGRSHKRVILGRSSSRRSQSQSQRPSAGYPAGLALPRPRGRRDKDDDDDDDDDADYDYGDHSSGYEDYFAGGPDWAASADAGHGVEMARATAEDAPISTATSASGSVRGGAKRRYVE